MRATVCCDQRRCRAGAPPAEALVHSTGTLSCQVSAPFLCLSGCRKQQDLQRKLEPFWKLEAALLPDAGLRGSQEGSTPVNRTKVPESRARLGHFLREMQLHEAWRLRRVRRRRWRGGPSVVQPALRLLGLQVPVAPSGLRLGVLHGACEGDLEVSSGLGFLSQQQGLVPRRARP